MISIGRVEEETKGNHRVQGTTNQHGKDLAWKPIPATHQLGDLKQVH